MNKLNIPFANLQAQYLCYKNEIDAAMNQVLHSGQFIMGPEVQKLEEALSQFLGGEVHAIACANGTDAIMLALLAIDIKPGDEVITTPFTFIAAAEMICLLGATPVFVDVEPDTLNIDATKIEEKITHKTKAIIPISLYGQTADMHLINEIALKAGARIGREIFVIEDAAQSFGAEYHGKKSCTLSKLACTSFFPAKPLGCYGDGGAVFTTDASLAKKIKCLSTHGQTQRYHHEYVGMNGRLDTLQAAVLLVKLAYYPNEIKQRQAAAKKYDALLSKINEISILKIKENRASVFAQYTLRAKHRDKIKLALDQHGIPTAVHYPKPLHLQPCFSTLSYKEGDFPCAEQAAKEVLSLPICAFLENDHQTLISDIVIKEFIRNHTRQL